MSGFLDEMARASAARVDAAKRVESLDSLERRARSRDAPPRLRLSSAGFDVIAEIKLRSPALGLLGQGGDEWLGRAAIYARAGAAAVSVLTEPTRFDGSLEHLSRAADALSPLGVPALRKDFIVDPYQVVEARAHGAGGVLLILRMLSGPQALELLEAAAAHGLFVLLEAFDGADLLRAEDLAKHRGGGSEAILVGLNCRDLSSLEIRPQRFRELAGQLPGGWPAVAESGIATAADAAEVKKWGYRLALIGTALMSSADPAGLIAEVLRAARTAQFQKD